MLKSLFKKWFWVLPLVIVVGLLAKEEHVRTTVFNYIVLGLIKFVVLDFIIILLLWAPPIVSFVAVLTLLVASLPVPRNQLLSRGGLDILLCYGLFWICLLGIIPDILYIGTFYEIWWMNGFAILLPLVIGLAIYRLYKKIILTDSLLIRICSICLLLLNVPALVIASWYVGNIVHPMPQIMKSYISPDHRREVVVYKVSNQSFLALRNVGEKKAIPIERRGNRSGCGENIRFIRWKNSREFLLSVDGREWETNVQSPAPFCDD